MTEELVIDARFCGPPRSGNGGYVCGRLALSIDGDALVRLRLPPPLGRPLALRRSGDAIELLDADAVVAHARPTRLQIEVPPAPDLAAARAAAARFRAFEDHPFPSCFVCGPDRPEGDGLRIFAGPLSPELVAAPWVPAPWLGDAEGLVAPEFIWSALDCPGSMSFPQPENGACVLGEFAVHIDAAVRTGEQCVVVGWEIEHDGRKHRTGTALFGAGGDCAAMALATWIEIPLP